MRTYDSFAPRRGLNVKGSGVLPSSATVMMFCVASSRRCVREMPATSDKVIVSSPFAAARGRPRADVAMVNRFGIVDSRERVVIVLDDCFHAASEQSEIGSIIVDTVRFYGVGIVRRDDIEAFWAERLNVGEQITVEA